MIAKCLAAAFAVLLSSAPLALIAQTQTGHCDRQIRFHSGATTIVVNDAKQLRNAMLQANQQGSTTIVVEPGVYDLTHTLVVSAPFITVRSSTGDRDSVTIRGKGMDSGPPHVFLVNAPHFTIANLSAGRVPHHVLQINGKPGADFLVVHNLRLFDSGEQLLKVTEGIPPRAAHGGIVQWSLFEFTAGVAPQWYTGGIDSHGSSDWIVRHNIFRHIRSPEHRLAEHAIHFWSGASGTIVTGNLITNADRGIGFGLGKSGHSGGLITNNMVHTTRDVGIGLESARGASVLHNSVFTENYPNSIEYRFADTAAQIHGNLSNTRIRKRDGGQATLSLNVDHARPNWFRQPTDGDLHLPMASRSITDKVSTDTTKIYDDFDCEVRPQGAGAEIGADEYQ